MAISIEEVRHVAKLARLELGESEVMSLQTELNALLGYFSELEKVNVEGIVAQSHAIDVRNVWAEDLAELTLTREEALKNAPSNKAGLFLVPTIIED